MRSSLGVLVCTACLATLGSAQSAVGRWQVPDVQEHVLANGFRLILVGRPAGGMVSARMFFGVGSVYDPPGVSGMAHLFEHLTYEGTARLGTLNWGQERQILDQLWTVEERIEQERNRLARALPHRNALQLDGRHVPLGEPIMPPGEALRDLEKQRDDLLMRRKAFNRPLDINNSAYYWGDTVSYAGTGVDATQYVWFLPANHLEAAMWVESDKFQPVFRNFYAARDTVQEQVLRWSIDEDAAFVRRLNEIFFSSSFGRDSGGGYELEQASPLDAREFLKQYVKPNTSHLVLVGEFDPRVAVELGERYFGRIPRGDPPPRVRVMAGAPAGERRLLVESQGRPRVELRFQIPPGASPANAALDLVINLLNGPRGRLARALKHPDDLVVSAAAARMTTRNYGYVAIVAYPRNNAQLPSVESLIIRVLDDLMTGSVTAEEIATARNQAETRFLRMVADSDALSLELGVQESVSTWRDVLERPANWAAVSPDRARETAIATFAPANRTVGILKQLRSGS